MKSSSSYKNRSETLSLLRQNPDVPVLIIGAGINGAGLFRELCLQGIDCLLIDKGDFMSGASAAPSRMIHGGLRYLENREVRLVKESLHERNWLLQYAPHYVQPLPTVIPIYYWASGMVNGVRKFLGLRASNTPRGAIIVKLGLLMYDIYTRTQRIMPTHSFTNREQSLRERPLLDPNIVCTALFYDAWISYPERLGIELIQDGLQQNPNALVMNYVSAIEATAGGVLLRDEETGETVRVRPKVVVNATGAWIDFTNAALGQKTRFIGGTKGSHLIIDNADLMAATRGQMVYYENDEGRICILFPLHGKVMVGSTDIRIDNPDEAVCTDDEVAYMLDCVRQVFPKLAIDPSQIVFRYSGVRPLPKAQGGLKNAERGPAQISRDHSIDTLEPTAERPFPVLNLIGGKWTTFRAFGEQTARQVLAYLNRPARTHSATIPIGGGHDFPKTPAERQAFIERVSEHSGLPAARVETLLTRYGTTAERIATYLTDAPDQPLTNHAGYTRREITYLIEHEFVQHVDDLILRRTVIALAGELTGPLLQELADLLADYRHLSDTQKAAEILRTKNILRQKHQLHLP
jgi:glycerol-3-phosphate dehydrogenase